MMAPPAQSCPAGQRPLAAYRMNQQVNKPQLCTLWMCVAMGIFNIIFGTAAFISSLYINYVYDEEDDSDEDISEEQIDNAQIVGIISGIVFVFIGACLVMSPFKESSLGFFKLMFLINFANIVFLAVLAILLIVGEIVTYWSLFVLGILELVLTIITVSILGYHAYDWCGARKRRENNGVPHMVPITDGAPTYYLPYPPAYIANEGIIEPVKQPLPDDPISQSA